MAAPIYLFSTLVVFLFSFSNKINDVSADKTPLYFSYITTITGNFRVSGAIPMVDRALDQINSRTDILENYTLNYTTILDSECSSSPSLNAFFSHFNDRSQPTYIASFCCGCSTATLPVAEISHQWNVPQVSYASAVTVLSDRERFKTLFRVLPSSVGSGGTYVNIMEKFNWTQITIITQPDLLFTKIKDEMETEILKKGWKLLHFPVSYGEYPNDEVFNSISENNHRIVILLCYGSCVISHLCEAHNRNMKHPNYVYFAFGGLPNDWWRQYPESTLPCSHDVIAEMINGSLSTLIEGYLPRQDNTHEFTSFEQRIDTFVDEYRSLLQLPQYNSYPETALVGVAYDAIWSLAVGLDIASKKIAAGNDSGCGHLPGDLVPLEQFDYYNERLGCVMTQSMEEVSFTGVTRDFKFVNRGPAENICILYQDRIQTDSGDIRKEQVGIVSKTINGNNTRSLNLLVGESPQSLWGMPDPPYDGASVTRYIPVHMSLQVIYYILASCGLIFVAACVIFNLLFRNKKVVKLASPNLNYIILIGSALSFISVYMYSFSTDNYSNITAFTVICNIEFMLFSLGYTICFAVILSKQWRIYYIFNNPTEKKKVIKDWHLLIIIVVIVVINQIILIVGMSIQKQRLRAEIVPYQQKIFSFSDDGIKEENFILICNSNNAFIWLVISYVYNATLQVVAIFMAFHTRKVRVKALNDSKEITAIIYINSIVLILLVVTEFLFISNANLRAALFSFGIIVEASIFVGIIFIPKMIALYSDPDGKRIFMSTSQQTPTGVDTSQLPKSLKNLESGKSVEEKSKAVPAIEEEKMVVLQMKARVEELEQQLEECKNDTKCGLKMDDSSCDSASA